MAMQSPDSVQSPGSKRQAQSDLQNRSLDGLSTSMFNPGGTKRKISFAGLDNASVNRPFSGLDGNELTRRIFNWSWGVFIADGIQRSQPIYKTFTLCTARFHGSVGCRSSSTPEGH